MKTRKKKYSDHPGYVAQRQNSLRPRAFDEHLVVLRPTEKLGHKKWAMTAPSGLVLLAARWATWCSAHDTLKPMDTQQKARHAMKDPASFCQKCAEGESLTQRPVNRINVVYTAPRRPGYGGPLGEDVLGTITPAAAYRNDLTTTRELVQAVAGRVTALTDATDKLVRWCEAAERVSGNGG